MALSAFPINTEGRYEVTSFPFYEGSFVLCRRRAREKKQKGKVKNLKK
jgi:hypothetical protein